MIGDYVLIACGALGLVLGVVLWMALGRRGWLNALIVSFVLWAGMAMFLVGMFHVVEGPPQTIKIHTVKDGHG